MKYNPHSNQLSIISESAIDQTEINQPGTDGSRYTHASMQYLNETYMRGYHEQDFPMYDPYQIVDGGLMERLDKQNEGQRGEYDQDSRAPRGNPRDNRGNRRGGCRNEGGRRDQRE
jgi:hypothetical protein